MARLIRKLTTLIKEKKTISPPSLMVDELIGQTYIPVKLKSTNITEKVFPDKTKVNNHQFESTNIIIESVAAYNLNVVTLVYMCDGKSMSVNVPKNMKVTLLVGEDKEKLLNDNADIIIKNLSSNLNHNFRIGSDPELFIEDENGIVIPAFQFLGSKTDKKTLTSHGSYGNLPLYWDGFQAEFETSAQNCLAWQVDSVQCGLKGALEQAKKFNPKAKLSSKTVMDIPQEMINSTAPEHIAFGCMPSLNVYELKGETIDGKDVPFRPAGGHIHFGIGKQSKEQCVNIVKALDAILGVACVSLFAAFDNPRRRTLYGLPGEYRLPPHGLEYRTLSNAWLFHPLIMNLVFDLGRKALVFGQKGLLKFWNATEQETIDCITTCNIEKAKEILERNKGILYQLFYACYGVEESKANIIYNIFINGMESAIEDCSNISGNWNLEDNWHTHGDGLGKNFKLAQPILVQGKKVS